MLTKEKEQEIKQKYMHMERAKKQYVKKTKLYITIQLNNKTIVYFDDITKNNPNC